MSNDICVNKMVESMNNNPQLMEALTLAAGEAVLNTGVPSFSRFVQALAIYSRENIKPQFANVKAGMKSDKTQVRSSNPKAPVDNAWRDEQMALFNGRGQKWIYTSVDMVADVLGDDEASMNYLDACMHRGLAWVHYCGPRIIDGELMASFEVRTDPGARSNTKVFLTHDEVMAGEFIRLEDGKTPTKLGLVNKTFGQDEEDDEPINILDVSAPEETNDDNSSDDMLVEDDNIDLEIFG